MYAKITKDYLGLGDLLPEREVRDGHVVIRSPIGAAGQDLLDVRLLDDDHELYYEAIATDDALEYLFEWAMRDAGVTILQTKKDGKWEDCIS